MCYFWVNFQSHRGHLGGDLRTLHTHTVLSITLEVDVPTRKVYAVASWLVCSTPVYYNHSFPQNLNHWLLEKSEVINLQMLIHGE